MPAGDMPPGGMLPPPPSNNNKPSDMNVANVDDEANKDSKGKPRGNPRLKYVWAVAGQVYGESQFVDNGDGTISDLGTGLMWMVDDSKQGLDWQSALAYSENLEYAGYSDWKLPNVKELQTLVDYSGVYPAIDQSLFNISDENAYFWTSTSAYFSKRAKQEHKRYWAWYVAFGYAVGPDGKDSHGAGAVRYDTKKSGGPAGEDAERIFNYVRAVRIIK
ncbi:DUF1566 domain-containing protein [Psychromonas sp. KJ10-10]|uniref:Lcl C-terminal domain-containing protein n=1 Tax=Psychromonas sp. KJ10-10 TaxID=3391823 RepID=UPI0039B3E25A